MNELVAAALVVAALWSPRLFARLPDRIARPLVATTGSLALAYGGREFLRAVGGGYYCCSHAYYAAAGVLIALAGWVALCVTLDLGSGAVRPGTRAPDDAKRSP